jgi:phosphoserine aminotransferase
MLRTGSSSRVYNFSAGPAMLPLEVMQRAKDEFLNWHGIGMSVMEISHRGEDYQVVAEEAESDLRDLLQIPASYKVLFLQGGARSQFAMVPLNLLGIKKTADYLETGIWSEIAIQEAARYCEVSVVASSKGSHYRTIPPREHWQQSEEAAYFHYVDNETINGVEFNTAPSVGNVPLVCDMSSNILSRPFDINQYALVYASAQKNVGPAGLTLVIVKEDLLGQALPFTPSMFNYKLHAIENSMYNTPPTFAWYMAGLTFKWIKSLGGLTAVAKLNEEKASALYIAIDQNDFYENNVEPLYRSRMNVIFNLKDKTLNNLFLEQARANGLANLKGHRLADGMRASIYNAMPLFGVQCLIDFMNYFSRRFG